MNLLLIFSIVFTLYIDVRSIEIGIIRNVSLSLTSIGGITINETTCQTCLCQMLTKNGNNSFVSLNCHRRDVNRFLCELFTSANYQISSSYEIKTDLNSTFYFIELPTTKRMLFSI